MAESKSSIDTSKSYHINWRSSDDIVIAEMKDLITALKSEEVNAVTILRGLDIGWYAAIHIFGRSGHDLCEPEVVSTWLSLLLTLASSKGITGGSMVSSFAKSCGGCMVYTILNAVGCFYSEENVKFAFDFFRHILSDMNGEILELDEIRQLSKLIVRTVPSRDDVVMRCVCLELHCYQRIYDMSDTTKNTLETLSNLVEGLGILCTSKSFVNEMQANRSSTIEILKQSIMNKTFSERFARDKWP